MRQMSSNTLTPSTCSCAVLTTESTSTLLMGLPGVVGEKSLAVGSLLPVRVRHSTRIYYNCSCAALITEFTLTLLTAPPGVAGARCQVMNSLPALQQQP